VRLIEGDRERQIELEIDTARNGLARETDRDWEQETDRLMTNRARDGDT
jgi:hypothetical protein